MHQLVVVCSLLIIFNQIDISSNPETAIEIRRLNMCSVLTGGRLATTSSSKSRNNPMEEMSEVESNPESPPKMSPRKTEEDNNQDREEELSVGSPGNLKE